MASCRRPSPCAGPWAISCRSSSFLTSPPLATSWSFCCYGIADSNDNKNKKQKTKKKNKRKKEGLLSSFHNRDCVRIQTAVSSSLANKSLFSFSCPLLSFDWLSLTFPINIHLWMGATFIRLYLIGSKCCGYLGNCLKKKQKQIPALYRYCNRIWNLTGAVYSLDCWPLWIDRFWLMGGLIGVYLVV